MLEAFRSIQLTNASSSKHALQIFVVRSRGPERPEKVIGWSGCRITDETADAYDEVIGAIDNARLPFLPDSIPPSSGDDGSGGEDHDDDPGDGKDKPKSAAAAAKPSNVAVPPARRLLEQGHRPLSVRPRAPVEKPPERLRNPGDGDPTGAA